MSDKDDPPVPHRGLPPEEIDLARQIVEVERARTEIEARAIEANDAQDKRISEFHNRRIELDNAENHRRFLLTNRIFLGVFVVVAI